MTYMIKVIVLVLFILQLKAHEMPVTLIQHYNGKPVGKDYIQIYAHRGGRAIAPENTLPAYRSALRQGVHYVDMDVNLAHDGTLVVTHDFLLNPDITRDDKGNFLSPEHISSIHAMNYSELMKYDVGRLKRGSEYAKFFPYQKGMDNVTMPTLKEVIGYVKSIAGNDVGFQIEIKNNAENPDETASPKEYAKALYAVLKEEQIIDRSEIQAFDFESLIQLQKLDSNVKTAYLTDHFDNPKSGDNKTLWTAGYKLEDFNNSMPQMVKALGGACWEPYEMDLTKAKLDEAHALGLKVVVWGWPEKEGNAFNYKRIEELIQWKVDGIITDRPDFLRAMLSIRGYNLPAGYDISKKE